MSLLDVVPEYPGTVGSMMEEPSASPPSGYVSKTEKAPRGSGAIRFGTDSIVQLSDAEISKNNRLTLLMDIHQQRAAKNQTQHKEVEQMTRKQQTCDGCGKLKALSNCSGDLLCSSCAALVGSIVNRPDAVAKMIIKRGKAESILKELGVGEVVAAQVGSELLQKLSLLVDYQGESGDELLAEIERQIDDANQLRKEYGEFLVRLRGALHAPDCSLVSLVSLVQKTMQEGAEYMDVKDALGLDLETTGETVLSAIQDLLSELDQLSPSATDPRADLESAQIALSVICRHLGIDESNPDLAYKDIVLAVAQTAAVLENLVRSSVVAMPISEQCSTLDSIGFIAGAASRFPSDIITAVRHSEAIIEAMMRLAGDLATCPADLPFLLKLQGDELYKMRINLKNKQDHINILTEQISDSEQKLLADEQVFARIREVIDADGVANGDLPTSISSLIHAPDPCPSKTNTILGSRLLDLLLDYPEIGVERIAEIKEVA